MKTTTTVILERSLQSGWLRFVLCSRECLYPLIVHVEHVFTHVWGFLIICEGLGLVIINAASLNTSNVRS